MIDRSLAVRSGRGHKVQIRSKESARTVAVAPHFCGVSLPSLWYSRWREAVLAGSEVSQYVGPPIGDRCSRLSGFALCCAVP